MGGRGSSGKASSGTQSSSPEQQTIMGLKIKSVWDSDGSKTKQKLLDENYTGTSQLTELLGSGRTFKDFEKVIGASQSEIITSVSKYHPGKSIKITRQTIKKDKYARGGGTPSKTRFFISIE